MNKMGDRINLIKKVAASWLGKKVEKWTSQKKKVCLGVFCLAGSAISLCLMTQSRNPLIIQQAKIPGHIGKTNDTIRILEKIYLLKRKK